MNNKGSFFSFFLMHIGFLVYSLYSFLGKCATGVDFLSFQFCCYYAVVILVLCIYALLWQQILKKIPLSIAMANKSITIVWGILLGRFFFSEEVKITMIIGASIILCGIFIISFDKDAEK